MNGYAGLWEAIDTAPADELPGLPDRAEFRLCGIAGNSSRSTPRRTTGPGSRSRWRHARPPSRSTCSPTPTRSFGSALAENAPVLVQGNLIRGADGPRLNVKECYPLDGAVSRLARKVTWLLRPDDPGLEDFLHGLRETVIREPGDTRIEFAMLLEGGVAAVAEASAGPLVEAHGPGVRGPALPSVRRRNQDRDAAARAEAGSAMGETLENHAALVLGLVGKGVPADAALREYLVGLPDARGGRPPLGQPCRVRLLPVAQLASPGRLRAEAHRIRARPPGPVRARPRERQGRGPCRARRACVAGLRDGADGGIPAQSPVRASAVDPREVGCGRGGRTGPGFLRRPGAPRRAFVTRRALLFPVPRHGGPAQGAGIPARGPSRSRTSPRSSSATPAPRRPARPGGTPAPARAERRSTSRT